MASIVLRPPKLVTIYRDINNCLWVSSCKLFDGLNPVKACEFTCPKTGSVWTYQVELYNHEVCKVIRRDGRIVEAVRCSI
jgi:hypothetical protein